MATGKPPFGSSGLLASPADGSRGAGAKPYNWPFYPHALLPSRQWPQPGPCWSCTMSVLGRIQAEVEGHPSLFFMNGTRQFRVCGFPSRSVQVLQAAGATTLHTVNVLEDPEIRANLPRYSNWPTFPQLFINGELIGGWAITMELFASGGTARGIREQ